LFEEENSTLVVHLFGEMDQQATEQLKYELNVVNAGEFLHLIFDLANVDFISSAGLSIFAFYADFFKTRGEKQQLKVINCNNLVMKLFTMTKMSELIEVLPA
jgi:anti-anti-sigma factor